MKKNFIPFLILFLLFNGMNKISAQEQPQTNVDTISPKIEEVKNSIEILNTELGFLKKIKISGYLHGQFQIADKPGTKTYEGGDFSTASDKRFMVRRGRLKVAYVTDITQFVIQIDATEKGVAVKDAYANFTEPWLKTFGITAGIFNRPFGFEIPYSSSLRESPERGRMSQILFPGERDLGAEIIVNLPKIIPFWSGFKLEAGLFSGNGINPDFKEYKDFIGRLSYSGTNKNEFFKFGAGVSYLKGTTYNGTKKIYTMQTLQDGITTGFGIDSTETNKGGNSVKEYLGIDAQFTFDFPFGITQLRGEFIMGQQPAYEGTTASTNDATYVKTLPAKDTYIRKFNGAYFYLVQNIGRSKFGIVVKYDWYDPNTRISGHDIKPTYDYNGSLNNKTLLSAADIKYQTLGVGVNFKMTENIKFTAYAAFVLNEKTNVSGYGGDISDNVYTLRLQYKF